MAKKKTAAKKKAKKKGPDKKTTTKKKPPVKKSATKKSTAKKPAKATKRKTAVPAALQNAVDVVGELTGRKPTDVLPGRFGLFAFRVKPENVLSSADAKSSAAEKLAVKAVVERLKDKLPGCVLVEGYYRSPAVFLLLENDQFRFFFADRKISPWIKQKGELLDLRLTGIQIGKFFYRPSKMLSAEEVKLLRAESKETFGPDNPISVSPERVTVRYG